MIVLKSVRAVASMAPPLKKIDDFVKPVFEKQLLTHGVRYLK